ncbi:Chromate resistance protein ChrB [Nocardiopsis changdeensis]|uniref:Chromate resistance protein ChrB n=1 Tax=Nocardiopsis TaxID=2013 RepID=UPI002102BE1F|nr:MULTISPECIES: Chromate resistance protein ChrB [Nocardiopsis]
MTDDAVRWMLAVVQVPAKPSRHRVAVWRELRRAGAVPVSQGTWALPAAEVFREAAARAGELAAEGGGRVAVFDVEPRDAAAREFIVDAFTAARVDEWGEYATDCGRFLEEIAKEIAKEKFTFAELEEEEQSLERLRRWFRDLKKRDVLALPQARDAAECLRACSDALDDYAERVYAAVHGGSSEG